MTKFTDRLEREIEIYENNGEDGRNFRKALEIVKLASDLKFWFWPVSRNDEIFYIAAIEIDTLELLQHLKGLCKDDN